LLNLWSLETAIEWQIIPNLIRVENEKETMGSESE
jgi:hypothetical protein